jgi:hypothetical protein
MPDLLAGAKIKALNFPPTVQVADNTAISNLTVMSYTNGSPQRSAPPSPHPSPTGWSSPRWLPAQQRGQF